MYSAAPVATLVTVPPLQDTQMFVAVPLPVPIGRYHNSVCSHTVGEAASVPVADESLVMVVGVPPAGQDVPVPPHLTVKVVAVTALFLATTPTTTNMSGLPLVGVRVNLAIGDVVP